MVNETAPVNEVSGNGMLVASPSTTVTFVPSSLWRSDAASRASISIDVRRGV